jgi:hypothetical protein
MTEHGSIGKATADGGRAIEGRSRLGQRVVRIAAVEPATAATTPLPMVIRLIDEVDVFGD